MLLWSSHITLSSRLSHHFRRKWRPSWLDLKRSANSFSKSHQHVLPRITPKQEADITSGNQLHIISWNACGIKNQSKFTSLKTYVGRHQPHVIIIREAFVGCQLVGENAPCLSGFVGYVHHVRNGLFSYIHSSIPHKLLRCSTDENMNYQLFEISMGDSKLRLCTVYSAPGRINHPALPAATAHGIIYMGDFDARHPALGDVASTSN